MEKRRFFPSSSSRSVQGELIHPQAGEQGVAPVGEDDIGLSRQADLMQTDGGKGLLPGRVIRIAQAEDVPVRSRTVIVVGEDAGMVQLDPADVVTALVQEVDQLEGGLQGPERSERVHLLVPPRLHHPEPALLHQHGVVAGIPVMRIHEGEIVQGEIQVGEIFQDVGAYLREPELSAVHILLREAVNKGRKHLRTQYDLQCDKRQQHQANQAQQDVPDNAQRFHYKDKDNEKTSIDTRLRALLRGNPRPGYGAIPRRECPATGRGPGRTARIQPRRCSGTGAGRVSRHSRRRKKRRCCPAGSPARSRSP